MVPCYPVWCVLPAFVERCFLTNAPPPFLFPWAPKASAFRFRPAFTSSLYLLTMNRSADSRTHWHHSPAFFAANGPHPVSTQNTNGQCSVAPSVAQTTPRYSPRHLCEVLACRPGLRPSPSAIVANNTRLGNRPFLSSRHGPRKEERPFTGGRSDALATHLLERLPV